VRYLALFALVIGILWGNEEILLFRYPSFVTPQQIEEAFEKGGYSIQQNRDMNGPYLKQFGQSDFAIYNLLTLYHPKIAMELVLEEPRSGIFAPFSVVIYRKKGDGHLFAGVLSARGMEKILGMESPLLDRLEQSNRSILQGLGGQLVPLSYKPKPTTKPLLTSYRFPVDPKEALDIKEEVEMVIEDGLGPIGFVMANFNDFNYDLKEAGIDSFLFYDTYSLCKLKVIYTLSKIRPEAGVFAPCTLAIYQQKGKGEMEILFPNVENWISTLALEDPEAIATLRKAQRDMEEVLRNAIP